MSVVYKLPVARC